MDGTASERVDCLNIEMKAHETSENYNIFHPNNEDWRKSSNLNTGCLQISASNLIKKSPIVKPVTEFGGIT